MLTTAILCSTSVGGTTCSLWLLQKHLFDKDLKLPDNTASMESGSKPSQTLKPASEAAWTGLTFRDLPSEASDS